MCDYQDPFAVIFPADCLESASESKDDIAPALAAGRSVVELSEGRAQGSLFWKARKDSISCEAIKDSKFLLPKALVLDSARGHTSVLEAAERLDYFGGLSRPKVWGGDDDRRALVYA
jgi:hypothetical protein